MTEQTDLTIQVQVHRQPWKTWINLHQQAWEPLQDEEGRELAGIRGKTGAVATGSDGIEVGLDLIEMAAFTQFPLHTHQGDHVLYCLQGRGGVLIGTIMYLFEAGRSIYINASIPHNVVAGGETLTFLAWGHPHKHVTASDRMQLVEDHPDQPWASYFPKGEEEG